MVSLRRPVSLVQRLVFKFGRNNVMNCDMSSQRQHIKLTQLTGQRRLGPHPLPHKRHLLPHLHDQMDLRPRRQSMAAHVLGQLTRSDQLERPRLGRALGHRPGALPRSAIEQDLSEPDGAQQQRPTSVGHISV